MNKNQTLNYLYRLKSFGIDYHDSIKANSKHENIMLDSATNIKELNKSVKNCFLCELHKQSKYKHTTTNSQKIDIMIINDFSTNSFDPFLGQAGKMLENICLNILKLTKEQIYWTNIIKCPIFDSSFITKENIEICQNYLQNEVDIIKPKVIVCFKNKISKQIELKIDDIKLVQTYSPSYLLRNPSKKQIVFDDMKKVYSILNYSSK